MGGAIGGIFSTIGEAQATSAEVAALNANAQWYGEQAQFAHRSTVRELKIQQQESTEFYGEKVSQIARGGIDMSGSPLILLAQTKLRAYEEGQAIIDEGNMQFKEASLKGRIASDQASATKSAGKTKMIGSTIGIASSAATLGMSGGKK